MSFSRHGQIYQSDVLFRPRSGALAGSAPGFIVLTSLRPAIPWRVGLHQRPPLLHQPVSIFSLPAVTVNHHLTRAGDFSTCEMRIFHPALTHATRMARSRREPGTKRGPDTARTQPLAGRKSGKPVAGRVPLELPAAIPDRRCPFLLRASHSCTFRHSPSSSNTLKLRRFCTGRRRATYQCAGPARLFGPFVTGRKRASIESA
jgi:hypothetical protein